MKDSELRLSPNRVKTPWRTRLKGFLRPGGFIFGGTEKPFNNTCMVIGSKFGNTQKIVGGGGGKNPVILFETSKIEKKEGEFNQPKGPQWENELGGGVVNYYSSGKGKRENMGGQSHVALRPAKWYVSCRR